MTGKPHKTVPTSLRNVAVTTWCKAVDELSGLDHLEGKDVAVFADGFVIANPNNDAFDTITVSSGSITLPKPRCVIHVGLPYLCDMETLDIDTIDGETLLDKEKLITHVTLVSEETRGVWVGGRPPTDDDDDPKEGLQEMKLRKNEAYDEPDNLQTGPIDTNIRNNWNNNGRVFLRQLDPVPMSALSIAAAGKIPYRR